MDAGGGGLFRTDGGIKVSSGLDIDCEVQEAWSKVRSGESTWLLMAYEGKSKLKLMASGSDSGSELLSCIRDDQVVFGGLRTKSGKFWCLMCTGADVGGLAKGRAAAHKNAAFNSLENFEQWFALPPPPSAHWLKFSRRLQGKAGNSWVIA